MHFLKIGAVAIALAALAGTSANALTTTQSASFHFSGFGTPSYVLDFATFNVPGQNLTSVHLTANFTDSFSYDGFQEFTYDDPDNGRYGVNVQLESYLDNNIYDLSFDAFWIGGDLNDNRSANWVPVPGEYGDSAHFSGSFQYNTQLNWDNFDNLNLYQNGAPLSFLYSHASSWTFYDFGGGVNYFSMDHTLDADFTLTYVSQAAVPEPASWALMIAGFGMLGTAMRRRRTTVAA